MATIKGCAAIRGHPHSSFGPKAEYIELKKLKRGKRKAQIELGGREETAKPATNPCSGPIATFLHSDTQRNDVFPHKSTLKDQFHMYGRAAGGHHRSFLGFIQLEN